MAENNRIDPVYKYVDNKVKNLKGQITKLRNRTETLELLGLQEQITSLSSRVKKLDSLLLALEQEVAHLQISHDVLYAQWAFEPMKQDTNAKDCIRFTRESASAALTEVRTNNNPLKVYDDWYSKCADYFRKHGGFEVFG